jgi:integrative and conjugative element protein (TIGR02256 family)
METGGILTGHYTSNLDTAIVNGVGRAPIDSRATYSTFERGELGVNRGLRMLWRRPCRRYYLGEWHFHPDTRTNLEPSGRDRAEMRRLASNPAVCCAEPLLVIVGGNPEQPWLLAAWVTAQQGRLVALMPETL